MLNSHSRPDPRSPFLHHGLAHAAAVTEHGDRARGMDPPSSSGRPTTPRRQLQGPRPPKLNVRAESHAIKKHSGSGVPAPGRAPVIIYDASPKVIHVKPSDFMALVQHLTGPGGSGTPPPPPQQHEGHMVDDDGGGGVPLGQAFLPPELLLSPSAAMSPAARLATIERSVRPMPAAAPAYGADDGTLAAALGPARHPGILSPVPSSLPPAAACGLFSPLPFDDPGSISWLNELSPILRAAASAANAGASSSGTGPGVATANGPLPPPAYYCDPFVPSPRNLLATPTVPSPATCAEFFGSLPDL